MRFAPHFLGLCLTVGWLACSSGSTTSTTILRPELVGVDPADFLGKVPCLPDDDAGVADGAKSYVATLFDVTECGAQGRGFPLPSSAATSCRLPVTFSFVVETHRYVAEVDAYDAPASALKPIAPGSRLQLNAASDQRVEPRWVATCGDYPPSPDPDAGLGGSTGTVNATCGVGQAGEAGSDEVRGVYSYSTLTQTPHDCGAGLVESRE